MSNIFSITDLQCHGDVLLLGVGVVLIDIEHYHSVGEREASVGTGQWFTVTLLQTQKRTTSQQG